MKAIRKPFRSVVGILFGVPLLVACSSGRDHSEPSASVAPPWASAQAAVVPRPGMVWVPAGTLVAGSALSDVPRVPDAEPPAVATLLAGFYVDVFLFPNESGALPTTNVTQAEALALCQAQEKRLCSELELERACKGPDNLVYPYGAVYKADVCEGIAPAVQSPSGIHSGCRSRFGMEDTHGTWTWTSSPWDRGTEGLVAQRGGTGRDGELVGRCAYGRGVRPDVASADTGFRCCGGPENVSRVELAVTTGAPLRYRVSDQAMLTRSGRAIQQLGAPEEGTLAKQPLDAPNARTLEVERTWTWHPAGNEELILAGGCSKPPKACGVFVLREEGEQLVPVLFLATDRWQPTISEGEAARVLLVQGGDAEGAFRKRLVYEWGRFSIGKKERRARGKKKRN